MTEHTNRLIDETSPYLLQHAHNPVDWYPWGEAAFGKARAEDRPILLSVGYSACHWCHVMAHESFEDQATAEYMNAHFVNIKVDREERPDVDAVYMQAVQALTQHGGWPLTAFLTPEGEPFYGGTYYPPEPRHGMPGFRQVLEAMSDVWRTRRDEAAGSAAELTRHLQQAARIAPGEGEPQPELLAEAATAIERRFEERHGGWGGAPKFPAPQTIEFLLRRSRDGDTVALAQAEATLDHMANGGIYDQLGGGFHRYSTDAEWLVPHFRRGVVELSVGEGAPRWTVDQRGLVGLLGDLAQHELRQEDVRDLDIGQRALVDHGNPPCASADQVKRYVDSVATAHGTDQAVLRDRGPGPVRARTATCVCRKRFGRCRGRDARCRVAAIGTPRHPRDDPSTWIDEAPSHLQPLKSAAPFRSIGTPRTLAAIAELLDREVRARATRRRSSSCSRCRDLWVVPHRSWHVDHDWKLAASAAPRAEDPLDVR